MNAVRLGFAVFLLLDALVSPARAELVTKLEVEVSPQPDKTYRYRYTLSNLAASDVGVKGLVLSISRNSALQAIEAPAGWNISYAQGDNIVTFSASSPASYITPTASATYSFTSGSDTSSQDYLILGSDSPPATNVGQVVSPGSQTY